MDAETYKIALESLTWNHARLLEFVAEEVRSGSLALDAPMPSIVETELVAERNGEEWKIALIGQPLLHAADQENRRARFLAGSIRLRGERFVSVLQRALAAGRTLCAAEVAAEEGVHVSTIERLVRGRSASIDGVLTPMTRLIDPDAIVETTRHAVSRGAFEDAADSRGIGDASTSEWPNNVLSARLVVLEGGAITREGEARVVRYDPKELGRVEALASAAELIVRSTPIGMKSESEDAFSSYYCVAPPEGRPIPEQVDEPFVRALFDGTICPVDEVRIEPFDEASSLFDGATPEALVAWNALLAFFREENLARASLISLGFFGTRTSNESSVAAPPDGFVSHGSCLPRLVIGFTSTGSIVGVAGHIVWT